jgi:DNA-binding MarR family transcriptional regulator
MDYDQLGRTLLMAMKKFGDSQVQKQIDASLHGEIFVLQYLAHKGGDVIPSEISDVMQVSTARVAATLNSLEDKGFITRQIDMSDRRRILVRLTSAGDRQAAEHREVALGNITDMLRGLGEHDAQEYVRITGRLVELISQPDE